MSIITRMTVDSDGLKLPLELKEKLGLRHNDWIRVCIKSDHIKLITSRIELDKEILDQLIHEGILIDAAVNV